MSVIDELLEHKYLLISSAFRAVDYFYIPKSKHSLDSTLKSHLQL